MAYRDIAKRRENDLARYHRRTRARREAGLCLRCGLCGVPHKPHDVDFTVMLSSIAVSLLSKGLTATHFT